MWVIERVAEVCSPLASLLGTWVSDSIVTKDGWSLPGRGYLQSFALNTSDVQIHLFFK